MLLPVAKERDFCMKNSKVCRILFVDPDADWLGFAVQTLKEQGIGAWGTTDIGRVERAAKIIPGVQLAFVDLEFAERVPDQLRHFAVRDDRYVVVLFPTDLTPYRMSYIFKLGAYDCVDKPYDAKSLIGLVESLTEEICLSTRDAVSFLTPGCFLVT